MCTKLGAGGTIWEGCGLMTVLAGHLYLSRVRNNFIRALLASLSSQVKSGVIQVKSGTDLSSQVKSGTRLDLT